MGVAQTCGCISQPQADAASNQPCQVVLAVPAEAAVLLAILPFEKEQVRQPVGNSWRSLWSGVGSTQGRALSRVTTPMSDDITELQGHQSNVEVISVCFHLI